MFGIGNESKRDKIDGLFVTLQRLELGELPKFRRQVETLQQAVKQRDDEVCRILVELRRREAALHEVRQECQELLKANEDHQEQVTKLEREKADLRRRLQHPPIIVKTFPARTCRHCGMELEIEQEMMPGRVHSCRGPEDGLSKELRQLCSLADEMRRIVTEMQKPT